MNTIEQTYFRILRQAVWGMKEQEEVALRTSDIEPLMRLAAAQGTMALTADIVMRDYSSSLNDTILTTLRQHCTHCMVHQQIVVEAMNRAIRALEKAGIRPVVMKGVSLARLYPKPYLREWGDVDLFVGKEAYHPGAAALRKAFPEAALFEAEEEYYKHYNITLPTTAIEMHRISVNITHPHDAALYARLEHLAMTDQCVETTDLWRSAGFTIDEDITGWEPEWKFNILLVFYHLWEHFVSSRSASIRQLCDLTLLMDKNLRTASAPDVVRYRELESYLRTNLTALHLLHVWKIVAYLLVNYLGLSADSCPLYDPSVSEQGERLLNEILTPHRVTYDTHRVPTNVVLRKLFTLSVRVRESRAIGVIEPHYAHHMLAATVAQSWDRFKHGENTRKWE